MIFTVGSLLFIGNSFISLYPISLHFFNKETLQTTHLERTRSITIGDNCWLGGNVTVCGGVTIGSGSVIGAGSVVTRDIPPDSFAAGVPCRVIRAITDADRMKNHPEMFDDPNDMRFFEEMPSAHKFLFVEDF